MPNDFTDMNTPNRNVSNPLATMMNNSDSEPKKLTGRDEEDCRRMLFNMFGSRYQIIGSRTILKGGFLGLGQKEYCEVRYIVKPLPMSSSESFEQTRRQLIEKITGDRGIQFLSPSLRISTRSLRNFRIQSIQSSQTFQWEPQVLSILRFRKLRICLCKTNFRFRTSTL